MIQMQIPSFLNIKADSTGRWRLWALFAFFSLIASIGTWITGQYQIGRLDSLKNKYDEPVLNYAKYYGEAPNNSLERDLLDGCKQAQIGTWLQTTDALKFDNPITGNRVGVKLDVTKAYIDLNGGEVSDCVVDEVEDRQFDIGSMTNTWAIILLLISFCLGAWTWVCRQGHIKNSKGRNIYAETLAETSSDSFTTEEQKTEQSNDGETKDPASTTEDKPDQKL